MKHGDDLKALLTYILLAQVVIIYLLLIVIMVNK